MGRLTWAGPADSRVSRIAFFLYLYLLAIAVAAIVLPGLSLLAYDGDVVIDWIHHSNRPFHQAHLEFQILVLALLVALTRPIRGALERTIRWVQANHQHRQGAIAAIAVSLILVTTYSLRGHIIMSSKGVPGWAYSGYTPATLATAPEGLSSPSGPDLAPFNAAIRPDVLPYLDTAGYLPGSIMLLHFRDGSARPGNFGLTVNTWPLWIFTIEQGEFRHASSFFEIVRHTFAKRRDGRLSALPAAISYPNHVNFQAIDYADYPPPEALVGITYWDAVTFVDPSAGKLQIVGLRKLAEYFE